MLLHLRRIASSFFFTLTILSAALWVRSYWYFDGISLRPQNSRPSRSPTRFTSTAGTIRFYKFTSPTIVPGDHWHLSHQPARSVPASVVIPAKDTKNALGFLWIDETLPGNRTNTDIRIPLWLPTTIFGLLVIAIRPKPRFKFSLADLFALTTVAALTVGPLTFWLRGISCLSPT